MSRHVMLLFRAIDAFDWRIGDTDAPTVPNGQTRTEREAMSTTSSVPYLTKGRIYVHEFTVRAVRAVKAVRAVRAVRNLIEDICNVFLILQLRTYILHKKRYPLLKVE